METNKDTFVWSGYGGTKYLSIHNDTDSIHAVKIRCSDNALFRITPPLGTILPRETLTVKIHRTRAPIKPDKIVVLAIPHKISAIRYNNLDSLKAALTKARIDLDEDYLRATCDVFVTLLRRYMRTRGAIALKVKQMMDAYVRKLDTRALAHAYAVFNSRCAHDGRRHDYRVLGLAWTMYKRLDWNAMSAKTLYEHVHNQIVIVLP
ncbi:unnamed protein product [Heligmosomoides polygyrus]|uniref:Major sperm protein n=1 Tax=Heligmosomoides polygyrus TaxID=6339 RepID=A0A3P7YE70_HELPZ|nr:unnamed protein product [Heligmosomoides polygyrus]